jgi:hypothetical protein
MQHHANVHRAALHTYVDVSLRRLMKIERCVVRLDQSRVVQRRLQHSILRAACCVVRVARGMFAWGMDCMGMGV